MYSKHIDFHGNFKQERLKVDFHLLRILLQKQEPLVFRSLIRELEESFHQFSNSNRSIYLNTSQIHCIANQNAWRIFAKIVYTHSINDINCYILVDLKQAVCGILQLLMIHTSKTKRYIWMWSCSWKWLYKQYAM